MLTGWLDGTVAPRDHAHFPRTTPPVLKFTVMSSRLHFRTKLWRKNFID